MGKLYWFAVCLVVVGGISASMYLGFQHDSESLIKYSEFQSNDEVFSELKSKIGKSIETQQIIFLGPHPQIPKQIDVAIKWANELRKNDSYILIVDSLMSERIPEIAKLNADVTMDLLKEKSGFLQGLSQLPDNKVIVVIAPNIYVTHFLQQSPIMQMQEELEKRKYVVLSFFNFPSKKSEEADFEFPCHPSASNTDGLDLGCIIRGQARLFYSHPRDSSKPNVGFLNRAHTREYMMFLN